MNRLYFLLLLLPLNAFAIDKYCSGSPAVIHPNGGGHVAITALVASTVFVGPEASICENAVVLGLSEIRDNARVYGYARISNGAIISDSAEVYGNVIVTANTSGEVVKISGTAKVYGNAKVYNDAIVRDSSSIYQNGVISDGAILEGNAQIFGNANVNQFAVIQGNAKISGTATVGANVIVKDSISLCSGRHYEAGTVISGSLNCTAIQLKPNVTHLITSETHTCIAATLSSSVGQMKCWGSAANGQLGTGDNEDIGDNELPIKLNYLPMGNRFSLGRNHTCSTNQLGVSCWGSGAYGQLGNGSLTNIGDDESLADLVVIPFSGITNLVSGKNHNCVLQYNAVTCWGRNDFGQLGYANTVDTNTANPLSNGMVNLGSGVSKISSRGHHTCVIQASTGINGVRCWGLNNYGQLGYGHTNNIGDDEVPSSAPIILFGSSSVQRIAVGDKHTCVLLYPNAVKCWGNNDFGQLGYANTLSIGDDEIASTAANVDVGGEVSEIFAGDNHTCVQLSTGKLRCWGLNDFGQLGYGHTNNIGDDENPSSSGDINIGTVSVVAPGSAHTCAIVNNRARCWGRNDLGQLGLGHTSDVYDPGSANEVINFVGNY